MSSEQSLRFRLARTFGGIMILVATAGLVAVAAAKAFGLVDGAVTGFETWRPVLYAYVAWCILLCWGLVLRHGDAGRQLLFILPAILFILAVAVFPTFFGVYIAMTDWNLSSFEGPSFNGASNLIRAAGDPYYWNAMANMAFYIAAIGAEYAIAFGLALLLNREIRARRFFRIAFLIPFMLSPIAVSWMIGKSMMEFRFGPVSNFERLIGWDNPAFFASPWAARMSIEVVDAWMFIPLMTILLLAGLQALPREVGEAADIDGVNAWQKFWKITFPLMLPVSITAIVLRIIFKLKLADIVIAITAGGPGGATDTVTSFIYREYRDRSNVGYGTMLAVIYLVVIIICMTTLLRALRRHRQPLA
jgi:multiple sugar transport system permease protein